MLNWIVALRPDAFSAHIVEALTGMGHEPVPLGSSLAVGSPYAMRLVAPLLRAAPALDERQQRTDNSPEGRFEEKLRYLLMPKYPYGVPVIGWKKEIEKLEAATRQKGYTLIPVKLYFKNGRVKCQLALAKGKQDWDKRATERNREADKEAKAAIARSQRS